MKFRHFLLTALLCIIGCAASAQQKYDKVVAQDGSGEFTTIQDAILSCKHFSYDPIYIFVKNGTYAEKLEIPSWITGVVLIGEDRDKTIIVNGDHAGRETQFSLATPMKKIMTFTSFTVKVLGYRTQLHNLTILNNAARRGQAVALHIEANGVLVKNCKLIGNQDTMYVNGEQDETLMVDSYIEGTTDFIFGSAQLFIDNCDIHCKSNSFITAASTPPGREFGFAIFNSRITAEPEVNKMFLGRPWRNYAKTVYIDCLMGEFITPAGWQNWGRPEAEKLAYYGEYGTKGSDVSQRVPWSHQLTKKEAQVYQKELARLRAKYLK